VSKVQMIEARADKAYLTLDQAWFNALPDIDLGVLWGIACAQGAAWDDEVYEALAARGFFEEEQT
jgi:hypothetical protein